MHEGYNQDQHCDSQKALPEKDPYREIKDPRVKKVLLMFDHNVIEGIEEWPLRKYAGFLLVANFIDDDIFRLSSLDEYLRAKKILPLENIGRVRKKLYAFNPDQLRVFMLLGAAAKTARGEDVVNWRWLAVNKFREVPGAVRYVLGEHELKKQLKI